MRTTCSPNAHATMDTPSLAVGVISDPVGYMGSIPEWERSTFERGNFYREFPHHAQNVLIALPGWGLDGGRWLLNIRMAFSPLACSLQSGDLDIIAGILVVCCSHPAPSSHFCHVWGKWLELCSCRSTANPFTC